MCVLKSGGFCQCFVAFVTRLSLEVEENNLALQVNESAVSQEKQLDSNFWVSAESVSLCLPA